MNKLPNSQASFWGSFFILYLRVRIYESNQFPLSYICKLFVRWDFSVCLCTWVASDCLPSSFRPSPANPTGLPFALRPSSAQAKLVCTSWAHQFGAEPERNMKGRHMLRHLLQTVWTPGLPWVLARHVGILTQLKFTASSLLAVYLTLLP